MDPPRYISAEELMRRSPLPVTKPYGRYFFIAFVVVPSAVTLTLLFVSVFVKHEWVPYVVVAATVYGLFAVYLRRAPGISLEALQIRHEYTSLQRQLSLSVTYGPYHPLRVAGGQPSFAGIEPQTWIRYKVSAGDPEEMVALVIASYAETGTNRILGLSGGRACSFPAHERANCVQGEVPEAADPDDRRRTIRLAEKVMGFLMELPGGYEWRECLEIEGRRRDGRDLLLAIYIACWWELAEVDSTNVLVTAGELTNYVGSAEATLGRVLARTKVRLTASGDAWRTARKLDLMGDHRRGETAERIKVVGDYYQVNAETVAAVGAGAEGRVFRSEAQDGIGGVELAGLLKELKILRTEMRSRASTGEEDAAVDAVDEAITAGERGATSAMTRHLRTAGRWSMDLAKAIGTGLAVAAIKSALDHHQ